MRTYKFTLRFAPAAILIALASAAGLRAQGPSGQPLALGGTKISLAGTSNIHAYAAATTTVKLVRIELAPGATTATLLEQATQPAGLAAFEIAIPAATLKSDKDGLDKNMHKALKVEQHPEITFRLTRLQAGAAASALKAIGVLKIAGVEREVTLDITTEVRNASLTVKGQLHLLMTDFGIAPPKAMLGMLKTDPKVTVTFETMLVMPVS